MPGARLLEEQSLQALLQQRDRGEARFIEVAVGYYGLEVLTDKVEQDTPAITNACFDGTRFKIIEVTEYDDHPSDGIETEWMIPAIFETLESPNRWSGLKAVVGTGVSAILDYESERRSCRLTLRIRGAGSEVSCLVLAQRLLKSRPEGPDGTIRFGPVLIAQGPYWTEVGEWDEVPDVQRRLEVAKAADGSV
jgi:hypothetical protein